MGHLRCSDPGSHLPCDNLGQPGTTYTPGMSAPLGRSSGGSSGEPRCIESHGGFTPLKWLGPVIERELVSSQFFLDNVGLKRLHRRFWVICQFRKSTCGFNMF